MLIVATALAGLCRSAVADDLAPTSDWQFPSAAAVRQAVLDWVARAASDRSVRARAEALWPSGDQAVLPHQLLQRLATTVALVRADAGRLLAQCARVGGQPASADIRLLSDPNCAPLVRNNLRLIYGRWLAQHRRFDEAETVFGALQPDDVVDSATLLFYQAVVQQALVHAPASREKLGRLLQRESELPRRYRQVARLMQSDLEGLRAGSLDHVARRMDDIERRLELGRANKKLQEVEDDVVRSLDKLIKQMEQQAQQQQVAGGASGQIQSSRPAADSRLLGGRGPGKVANKKIGNSADWGNLPEKQRQEAMQQIGRRFPSYYRRAVEQYFKRLAREQ